MTSSFRIAANFVWPFYVRPSPLKPISMTLIQPPNALRRLRLWRPRPHGAFSSSALSAFPYVALGVSRSVQSTAARPGVGREVPGSGAIPPA